ncbi:MAG: hypothetical protein WDM89_04080 [Rhizomicrobium sp.]
MNRIIATILLLAASSGVALADSTMSETARNPHNFILKLDMNNFNNGEWSGDATFTISACPQKTCYHLSGKASLPLSHSTSLNEGLFSIPGASCDLHFEEVPHDDMDSGDWRITPISRNGKQGCASLPSGIAGVYKEIN